MKDLQWKSCGVGLCLEVARDGNKTLLRDSREPAKIIAVDAASWQAFIASAKSGDLDNL